MVVLFYNDDKLSDFENENKWMETVEYLYEKFLSTSNRKDILLRLTVQCWYIIVFWDCCMPICTMEKSYFNEKLEEMYKTILGKWTQDVECIALLGYMMSVSPNSFEFIEEDIFQIERMGEELIEMAHAIDSGSALAEVFYYSEKKGQKLFLKGKIQSMIKQMFSGNSAVDEYFFDVCNHILNSIQ